MHKNIIHIYINIKNKCTPFHYCAFYKDITVSGEDDVKQSKKLGIKSRVYISLSEYDGAFGAIPKWDT